MTGFDLSTIQNCYIGGAAASAIYLGSTKIWPATPHDYSQDYFTIVSLEDNNDITFYTSGSSDPNNATRLTISISTDGGSNWTQKTPNVYDSSNNYYYVQLATLNTGNKLLIKGNNNTYDPTTYTHYIRSASDKTFDIEGNIMSLIYGDNFTNQLSLPINTSRNFANFFYNSTVVSAENLILPATTLMPSCYASMFSGCSALTTAPDLPATTLTSLCYYNMFSKCTSLLKAPDLLATILTQSCYQSMLAGCSSLNYIKCLATDISATNCVENWCGSILPDFVFSASGTFVKDANTTWPTGSSGIPSGWTVENYTPSSYTITISDPDQVLFSPPIINANGYQAAAPVSIDMGNVYDQYDGTEDDEFVFDITCSDPNLQYDFLYGEVETDEFGDEISSTNAHLDIQSMPSHNLTFTFTLTSNPDASSDEEGGDEEE